MVKELSIMNKFNKFVEKRNFKKIFIIYIAVAIICGIACAGAVGYVFRDKISFAVQYKRAGESLQDRRTDGQKL